LTEATPTGAPGAHPLSLKGRSPSGPSSSGRRHAVWADDGLGATLLDQSGSWLASLGVVEWYAAGDRDAVLTWVVSWPAAGDEPPYMLEAVVERPALVADTAERRRSLVEQARAAMTAPAATPAPLELPPPTPASASQWSTHLELQLACWGDASAALSVAAAERDADRGPYLRYKALTDALERSYALDASLGILWRAGLSTAKREQLSQRTDRGARSAMAHNAAVRPDRDPTQDTVFAAYLRRDAGGRRQPYRHWADMLLAGMFQERFFQATRWVRGQLTHAAVPAPIELRHFRAGAEPRWKWRESASFARGRSDDAGRRAYDRMLAGHDVLGQLGQLYTVYFDAQLLLVAALREEEAAAGR
jgi:hypothetical protein